MACSLETCHTDVADFFMQPEKFRTARDEQLRLLRGLLPAYRHSNKPPFLIGTWAGLNNPPFSVQIEMITCLGREKSTGQEGLMKS
jgi:hypothetical protein